MYRARDPCLSRFAAIKVLPACLSNDPDRLRRFEQEARATGLLNHPNVLVIYDLGTSDGAPYIVSDLLEGETLRAGLAGGALPAREATEYGIQIPNGLAAAHEKDIVHHDLKPENLFLTTDGRVKILDFGLAKLTEVATVSGTGNFDASVRWVVNDVPGGNSTVGTVVAGLYTARSNCNIAIQHLNSSGQTTWGANQVYISQEPNLQLAPTLQPNGTGAKTRLEPGLSASH
jgi:serine/threonine protein kinase